MANGLGANYDHIFFDSDTPTHTATGTPYRTKVDNTIGDINKILGGGVGDFLAKLLGRNTSKDLQNLQEYETEFDANGQRINQSSGGSSGGGSSGGGSSGNFLNNVPTWLVVAIVGGGVLWFTQRKK